MEFFQTNKFAAFNDGNVNPYEPNEQAHKNCMQQDSGFKAWDGDNVLTENSHINLLRNFKSQLLTYEQKFKKLETNKTMPIKLPALPYMKQKKRYQKDHQKTNESKEQQLVLTERKQLNSTQNINIVKKHKSIDLNKISIENKNKNQNKSFNKFQARQRNHTIDHLEQKNQPIMITKVQQMKFEENHKRIRKRDLYLALFGDKGKGKVQKIQFDDQNKAYQIYLQRKNQRLKNSAGVNISVNQKEKQQRSKLRCSSQLNNRQNTKKTQQTVHNKNILGQNKSHLPIRF